MIYSNINLEVKVRQMKFGDLRCLTLGERGRGRKEIILPSIYDIKCGLNKGLTIGETKSGRPRVNRVDSDKDNTLFIILDTYGGYPRRHHGSINCKIEQGIEIIAEGNGAEGDAGGIGWWGVFVLEAPVDNNLKFIKIDYSGDEKATNYIAIIGQDVRLIPENYLYSFFDSIYKNMTDYKYLLDDRQVYLPCGTTMCGEKFYHIQELVYMDPDQFFVDEERRQLRHVDSTLTHSSTRVDENYAVEVYYDENHEHRGYDVYKIKGRYFYPIHDWEKEMLESKIKLGY